MKLKKELYDDMTGIALVMVRLAHLVESALDGKLSPAELSEGERDIRLTAGSGGIHPAFESPLLPFAVLVLDQLKSHLSGQKDRPKLAEFANIINGAQTAEVRIDCDPIAPAGFPGVPRWFVQVRDAGEKLLQNAPDSSWTAEKLGALLRNIPADITAGFLAHRFFHLLLMDPPGRENALRLWSFLSGQKPLRAKAQIRGLYAHLSLG